MNPLLLVDSYKVHHTNMYPEGMTKLYSNLTPRTSRKAGVNNVVFFGLQHFCMKYFITDMDKWFFKRDKDIVMDEYKRFVPLDDYGHIEALHDLGYLPLEIKALPEGAKVPIGVPCLTITNTHDDFAWLTNYVETLMSCMLWQPITSATIANEFKELLNKNALLTTGSVAGAEWQGHDFSMRGLSSAESAILSGMGHLLSFPGTDTIPAMVQIASSYGSEGLIGASVPATEHSVMCMGEKETEVETFKRLMKLYPNGILSIVSDTWDLWKVLTEYLPQVKKEIMGRGGKLVIRPDSGNPVDIICGLEGKYGYSLIERDGQPRLRDNDTSLSKDVSKAEVKGVVELLWDEFGGTVNAQGYKELDAHIGAIYGDSITIDRANEICERLKAKGFASTNVVLGIGSYTYQYNTRDTFGFAVKATYGEVELNHEAKMKAGPNDVYTSNIEHREIFKDPITDNGTKKSAKGLLRVELEDGRYVLHDQQTKEQEAQGEMKQVFIDGKLTSLTSLDEIRERLSNQLAMVPAES